MAGFELVVTSTFGCVYIGVVLTIFLYGCTCAQALHYSHHYHKDKIAIKALVLVLWLLDTARLYLVTDYLWYYFVKNHGSLPALETIAKTSAPEYTIGAVTVFIVQSFFIFNIWSLIGTTQWYRIPHSVVAICLALSSAAAAMVVTYVQTQYQDDILMVKVAAKTPATISSVCAFVADVYITACLCLVMHSRVTGVKKTNNIISKLITYAINRGILTSLVQMLVFVQYGSADDGNLISDTFHLVAPTLYVNTTMAVLNVRQYLGSQLYTSIAQPSNPCHSVHCNEATSCAGV